MKEFVMKYKVLFLILLVAVLIAVGGCGSSTQWTRDFDLKYVDHVSDWENGNSYEIYEITNNTHRTLKDVSVVISVEYYNGAFKYEDRVAGSIRPGGTVEYWLTDKDYKRAAEEQNVHLIYGGDTEIVEIKYSK